MTINDLTLNEQLVRLHLAAATLDSLTREGKENSLFRALSDIEHAAWCAQNRLNELRFSK